MLSGLENIWINFGTHVFPPTVHPMVVHFPIALLFLTLLLDVAAFASARRRDRLFERMGFLTLTLSLLAIIAAGAAGLISEHFVHWSHTTRAILSAHQRDAFLTGFFALAAWIIRWLSRYPSSALGSDTHRQSHGRGKLTFWSALFVLAAVIMVSITGTLGGSMVYGHGVGVAHVTLKTGG